MPELHEYVGPSGASLFKRWFDRLDPVAAAKVTIALARLEQAARWTD